MFPRLSVSMKRIAAAVLGVMAVVSPIRAAETVTYYYTSPQGTVLATTDGAGNVLSTADYRPYGLQALGLRQDGPGYAGHVNDVDSGLVYMQARYYDPVTGRFTTTDPKEPEAADLYAFGRYSYANLNPYRFVDRDGREASLYWSSPTNVTATIRYNSVGVGLPFSATAMVLNTQQRLSGLTNINGKIVNLTTKLQLDTSGAKNVTTLVVVPDTATVTQSGRPETNKIGGDVVTLSHAMNSTASQNAASHEFGHVAGAGDQYKGGVDVSGKTLPADVPGDPNIMKDLSGSGANDQTLREVIQSPANTNTCAPGIHAASGSC